jgi:hypothetical protein
VTYTFKAARYANATTTAIIADTDEVGLVLLSDIDTPHEWQALIDTGIAIQPYVPFALPTLDQIYDQTLQNQRLLKGLILALNDGSLPVGQNRTAPQVKAAIRAKM